MSRIYEDFEWSNRLSSDHDTIDRFLYEGFKPETPSASDMNSAIEWLALYGADHEDDPMLRSLANVIGFLGKQIEAKESRERINASKRQYAKEHNIPFKQLRVKK